MDIDQEKFIELVKTAETDGRLVFILFQDADGNWRGAKNLRGKEVYVRDVGPETVLQLLLTHDGKAT